MNKIQKARQRYLFFFSFFRKFVQEYFFFFEDIYMCVCILKIDINFNGIPRITRFHVFIRYEKRILTKNLLKTVSLTRNEK